MSLNTIWPPSSVVPEHRKQANMLWTVLLGTFAGYIAWYGYRSIHAIRNPPVTYSFIQNQFVMPDLGICLTERYGCGLNYTEKCAKTLAIMSQISGLDGFTETDTTAITLKYDTAFDNSSHKCIFVGLSTLVPDSSDLSIDMGLAWVPYLDNLNVSIQQAQLVLYEPGMTPEERAASAASTYLSYTVYAQNKTLPDMPQHTVLTSMEQYLDLNSQATNTYSVSSTQSWYKFVNRALNTDPYDTALLGLTLNIPHVQYTQIKETTPWDVLAFLGVVGGFWGYVVAVYGMCVYSSAQQEQYRIRDWRETALGVHKTLVSNRFLGAKPNAKGVDSEEAIVIAQSNHSSVQGFPVPAYSTSTSQKSQRGLPGLTGPSVTVHDVPRRQYSLDANNVFQPNSAPDWPPSASMGSSNVTPVHQRSVVSAVATPGWDQSFSRSGPSAAPVWQQSVSHDSVNPLPLWQPSGHAEGFNA